MTSPDITTGAAHRRQPPPDGSRRRVTFEPPGHRAPATESSRAAAMTDDLRITHGYDPDADGSYHPDPEDYPSAPDEVIPASRPRRSSSLAISRRSGRSPLSDTVPTATPAEEVSPSTPFPEDEFPGDDYPPGSTPAVADRRAARRLTDKGLFAAIIAGVLGVAVLMILTYGFTQPDTSGPQSSIATPTTPASTDDAQDDPVPPADTAPPADAPTADPQETTTAEVPTPGQAEPREPGDDHDEDGDEQDDD